MANPLAMLRRHQWIILAGCAAVAIVTFTVGPIVLDYQQTARNAAAEGRDEVLATWKYGRIRQSDVNAFRMRHNLTIRFLDEIVRRTQQAKGFPRGIGVNFDRMGQVIDPGIPRNDDTSQIVSTMLLARKAEEMGIVISDDVVDVFLSELSNDLVSPPEREEIHRGIAQYMSAQQLIDHLRTELMAQQARLLSVPGTVALTPITIWDYHNRLHRRVQAEVLPIKVDDSLKDVKTEPTAAQIQELYEKHKDFFPHPDSPEPGFKRRKKASFEFVKADFAKILAEESAKVRPEVTDQEIEEYYATNKSQFTVPESPQTEEPAEKPDAKPEEKPAEKPEEKPTEPDVEKPADKPGDKPTDKPAEPSNDKPEEKSSPKPDAPPKEDAVPKDDEAPCGDDETKVEPQAGEPKPAAEKANPSADEPKTDKPVADKPDADKPDADKPAPSPSETEKGEPDSPTSDKPDGAAQPPKKEPQYKPLDDALRDEIRGRVAEQRAKKPAQDRMDQSFTNVRHKVQDYNRDYVSWDAVKEIRKNAVEPAKPDFAKLAQENGLEFGTLEMVDALDVAQYELGRAVNFVFERGFQQITFAEVAFADNLPTFAPERTTAGLDSHFLYWKTAEKAGFVPKLEECREEVVTAWKRAQALELARQRAEELAGEARKVERSLSDTFADRAGLTVAQTQEFSWLTMGSMAFGGGSPMISGVENVVSPGDDFMRAVFALKTGEVGVAVNEPKSIVYVVRLVGDNPAVETRREEFLESHRNMQTEMVANSEIRQIIFNWYEDLEKEFQLVWTAAGREARLR